MNLISKRERQKAIAGLLLFACSLMPVSSFSASGAELVLTGDDETVSFQNDVMAVLSKAGCNMGACHGALKGKGGFKLSLRGESPALDLKAILDAKASRRVLPESPETSFLLRKPTKQTGHEGGKRFGIDSPEHAVLLRWIRDGAKPDPDTVPTLTELDVAPSEVVLIDPQTDVQLQVTAQFSDGTSRDVSRWAVYEPFHLNATVTKNGLVERVAFGEATIGVRYLHMQRPVRVAFVEARPDWNWSAPSANNLVDIHVFNKLRTLRMNPSDDCSDSEFIRRATLDVTGRLPNAQEARDFAHDSDVNKRSKLINELLQKPAFADFWALKWSDILRVEEKVLDDTGVKVFHGWIRDSIHAGMPLDEFARAILTATGSSYNNPPTNYYRALRNPTARAEAAAQVFLGTRMQCARCHNHPYEKWTQDQYYELAAAFDGIQYKIVSNNRRDGLDKHQFRGEQLVVLSSKREQKHPRTKSFPSPGFLGEIPTPTNLTALIKTPPERAGALHSYAMNRAFFSSLRTTTPEHQQLQKLAQWITSPENHLFARTQVNRIWYHLMGQGIIDPVDDLRATNPPVNPALLDALVNEFVDSGYDLRQLIRTIMSSRTYGLSAQPTASNAGDETNFSHARIQRLTAEQLLDAVHQVTETTLEMKDLEKGTRAVQVAGVPIAARELKPGSCEQFLKVFGKPERLLNSDMERTNATSLAQVLELTSGKTIHRLLRDSDNALGALLNNNQPPVETITEVFWSTLSRQPTSEESQVLSQYLQDAQNPRSALEDIYWSILNSKAFLLRH